MAMSPLTTIEFKQIQQLLCEQCGLYLHDGQDYLVQTRLSQFATNLGLRNFSELTTRLRATPEKLLPSVINLMTTNETWWFRDDSCWNALEKIILPACITKLNREHHFIRIWIAGCSTGQEAYSLAILIDELCQRIDKPELSSRFYIEAMDISESALTIARQARFNAIEMRRGLSLIRRKTYFSEHGNVYVLNDSIRQRVHFKAINLINDFTYLGQFDLILCRNVTIYFMPHCRQKILLAMSKMLISQGALLIGATESWGKIELNTVAFEDCIYFKAS